MLIPDKKNRFPYVHDPMITIPELYDMDNDISEKSNLAEKHPMFVNKLLRLAEKVQEDLMSLWSFRSSNSVLISAENLVSLIYYEMKL